MSGTLRLKGSTSGYSELQAPAVAGDQTFILPVEGGTLLTTDSPFPTLTLESGTVTSPPLTFEGDSNTGIYSPGADELAITTSGVQRLVADSSGNVGIGTSSPGSLLHIASSGEARLIIDGDINNGANENAALIELKTDAGAVRHRVIAPEGTNNNLEIVAGSSGTSSSVSSSVLFSTKSSGANSTERMRIDNSGNVGIGTSSPQEKLHLIGKARIDDTDTIAISLKDNGSGNFYGFIGRGTDEALYINGGGTTPELSLRTVGTERLRIDSSGNVGIGTDSPSTLLTLASSDPRITITDTDAGGNIELRNTSGAGYLGTLGTHPFIFLSDGAERMRITGGGDVGIGTTSPSAKLEIAEPVGSTTPAKMRFLNDGERGVTVGFDDHNAAPAFSISSGNQSIKFISIASDGDVGIGTSSPTEKLHVKEGNIVIGQESGATTGIRNYIKFGREGSPKAAIGFLNNASNGRGELLFMNDVVSDGNEFGNGDEVMRIDINQRLVLGGISPTTAVAYSVCTSGRLQTTASYTNTTGSAANMFINSSGLVIRSTSSARYKTNIETLENSYADKLLECRPVWYRSIATDDTTHPQWSYYGFIAEEVANVDPRLVHFDEQEDGTLQPEGVQYTQMIAHLVNIVKRQKQQLVDLEARLSALETAN